MEVKVETGVLMIQRTPDNDAKLRHDNRMGVREMRGGGETIPNTADWMGSVSLNRYRHSARRGLAGVPSAQTEHDTS